MLYNNSFIQYSNELSDSKYDPLPADKERELLIKYYKTQSEECFTQLVNANLRFVVYSLRSYKMPFTSDIMDFIQEGNLGLIAGIRRYNPKKYKCRLFSYCFYWIRLYVNTALNKVNRNERLFERLGETEKLSVDSEEAEKFSEKQYASISRDILKMFKSYLDARQSKILSLFFGIEYPYVPKTLEEVGSILHMTLERVRQIREEALEILRKKII